MKYLLTGEGEVRPQLTELVINWHVTEVCNYRCRYCYAKWQSSGRELIHNAEAGRAMLRNVFDFFHPSNLANPLRQYLEWGALRLNLAGGEPLLYLEEIDKLIDFARQLGFATSIITNASRLTLNAAEELSPKLSVLGLSLDSIDKHTNTLIGRADRHDKVLDANGLIAVVDAARRANPRLRLKVNTVVNALNADENMTDVIKSLAPDRWKVLRMLPVLTNDLAVSDAEFQCFVACHGALKDILCAEDNADMGESYIMLDPHGRFFQNMSAGAGYFYSRPIHEVGVARAFSDITLSPARYRARYVGSTIELPA